MTPPVSSPNHKDTEVCRRHRPTAKYIKQEPKNEIQNEMKMKIKLINEKMKYENTKFALESKNKPLPEHKVGAGAVAV